MFFQDLEISRYLQNFSGLQNFRDLQIVVQTLKILILLRISYKFAALQHFTIFEVDGSYVNMK